MTEFRFASPAYLLFVLSLPVVSLLLGRMDSNARSRLLRLMAEENLRRLLVTRGQLREQGKRMAFWLGLVCCILALARPQANPTIEELPSTGLDIYVLLDVSRSMDAEDVAPSRLKKAKREIQHLMSRLAGDRLGLIAFAQSAALVAPLTSDYSIIEGYLQNIDTSLIPSQGTNLERALGVAKEAMARGARSSGNQDSRSNVFLVMSDGEDFGASNLKVVDEIKDSGGIVFAIAFGTKKGVPIPIRTERGDLSYKRDAAGNTVITAVIPGALEEAARRGAGHFYFATIDESEIEDILARVGDLSRKSYATIKTKVYEEWYPPVLGLGLLLLLFSFVPLRDLATRLRPLRAKKGLAAVILLALALPSAAEANPFSWLWTTEKRTSEKSQDLAKEGKPSEAVEALKELQAENPDNAEVNYNIGTYFLSDKKGQEGRDQLSRLHGSNSPLASAALFNIAGSYALEEKKDAARGAYAQLLHELAQKPQLSEGEKKLQELAKQNLARLADANQAPQQSQGNGQQNPQDPSQKKEDQQSQEGQGDDQKNKPQPKEGKDDKPSDQKAKEQEKQEQSGEQNKKPQEENKPEEKESKQEAPSNLPPRQGGTPFRERDNMGEEDAKRILGALKERETALQKKFLKNKAKGGKVNDDDAAKDW